MEEILIRALRARGIDIVSAWEAGMAGRKDSEHLEYAAASGRVICTFNLKDFLPLHAQYMKAGRHHAGMILAKQQEYSVGEVMRRLLKLIAALSAEEMKDRAEFLSNW